MFSGSFCIFWSCMLLKIIFSGSLVCNGPVVVDSCFLDPPVCPGPVVVDSCFWISCMSWSRGCRFGFSGSPVCHGPVVVDSCFLDLPVCHGPVVVDSCFLDPLYNLVKGSCFLNPPVCSGARFLFSESPCMSWMKINVFWIPLYVLVPWLKVNEEDVLWPCLVFPQAISVVLLNFTLTHLFTNTLHTFTLYTHSLLIHTLHSHSSFIHTLYILLTHSYSVPTIYLFILFTHSSLIHTLYTPLTHSHSIHTL